MTNQEVFLINACICVGFGVGGFLLRMTLEAWRDYHIEKALHETQQLTRVRHYRYARHRKPVIPKEVLARFMTGLKRKKTAYMTRIDGRWRNAA